MSMRDYKDVLFDINNWQSSGKHGECHELATIAEILLDLREIMKTNHE